jgi:hypothetical protein
MTLAQVHGLELAYIPGRRGDGKINRPVHGGREDEAFIVVGVFADEVDPAGRPEERRCFPIKGPVGRERFLGLDALSVEELGFG